MEAFAKGLVAIVLALALAVLASKGFLMVAKNLNGAEACSGLNPSVPSEDKVES